MTYAIIAMIFGFFAVVYSFPLLWYNEKRLVAQLEIHNDAYKICQEMGVNKPVEAQKKEKKKKKKKADEE
jgi:hypothetical protein